MKVILYMAMTVNGMIASQDDDTSWTSKEDWAGFEAICHRAGNVIIGRRTYDMVKKEGTQLEDVLTIVMTHDKDLRSSSSKTLITTQPAQKVLTLVAQKGFKTALVAGGGQINSLFMKEGLIDELYVDIEPLILGSGIPLFSSNGFETRLQLLSAKKLNTHTIQLHYNVLK